MHKLRLTEKSSRQRITNESNNNLLMKKKVEEAERKIERLNTVIQVRSYIHSFYYLSFLTITYIVLTPLELN